MHDFKSLKIVLKKFNVILSKSQKMWAIVVFVCTLAGALFETLGVSVIVPLLQAMVNPDVVRNAIRKAVGSNALAAGLLSPFNAASNSQIMFLTAGLVIGVYIVKNIYLSALAYLRVKYSSKVQRELSVKIANSYIKRGYPFFLGTSSGDLIRGIAGSVSGVFMVLNQLFRMVAELLTIACICIFLLKTDVFLAGSIVALTLFCVGLTTWSFRKRVKYYGDLSFRYNSIVSQSQLELFNGIKEVLVMKRAKFFLDRYEKAYARRENASVNQSVSAEWPAYIIEGICVSGIILAVCFRVRGMDSPMDYLPQLAAFAVAAFRILPSLGRVSSSINTCVFYLTAVDETYNNILALNQYADLNNDSEIVTDEYKDFAFEQCITVENVVWQYAEGKMPVLDGVDMEIKKGQSVAFIGQSGAGKTTLGDVILGLLVPQRGRVCIDGVDIRKLGGKLCDIIGFVPQSIYLTDDTIRKNIAFGVADKEIDDHKIWRALEKAQMKEFVTELPKGLDTLVGERGTRLSGGQRQRMAIARALYLDPQILVLDEATSALDTETETAVMESIDALQGQKTLIIIAHRLSTIKNCDVVYEIIGGKAIKKEMR